MIFEQERREIVTICLKLADRGYLAGTGGNVAYRVNDEYFAVTPSATDYYAMGPEDICVLRLEDFAQIEGNRRPSIEHKLHAHVLRTRRECRASIHTHQPIASAYSLLGRSLEILDLQHEHLLGNKAALVAYAPSGTGWLASKLLKALRPEINAYLMQNHGALCCGPTLDEAADRVEALELACAAFFRASINHRIALANEPILSKVLTLLAHSEDTEPLQ
jgi:L-fuculose-phosphate aldolase